MSLTNSKISTNSEPKQLSVAPSKKFYNKGPSCLWFEYDSKRLRVFVMKCTNRFEIQFLFAGDKDSKDEKSESKGSNGIQTLDSLQAMCLPLGASVSLLVMFFFFDSMQMLFAICTAVIATVALAFLLLPMCQYLMR
jgi:hypothetical protein